METSLDFDYLCELNKTNPEQFEVERQKLIDQAIKSARASSQRRLRGLQFQVDAKRQIHKNAPFAACLEVSKMMHHSFNEMRCRLNEAITPEKPAPISTKQSQTAKQHENVVVRLSPE
jgi:hypothetical protein